MKRIILQVDGMMCGMCEAHVNDAIRKAANVKKVVSSHTKGTSEVICEDEIDANIFKTAIENDGYKVSSYSEEPYTKRGIFAKLSAK